MTTARPRVTALRLGLAFGIALVGLLVTTVLLGDSDSNLYRGYALAFWTHPPIGHSLPAEYPPLSVLVFSLALVPPGPAASLVFGTWMAALALLLCRVMARLESPGRAAVLALYLVLCGVGTLVGRFDLAPAALTLAVYWLARHGRFGVAYPLLAAAILLKLYPAVLVPVLAIEQVRRAREAGASRRGAAFEAGAGVAALGAIIAAVLLAARWRAGAGWAGALAFLAARPVQVESGPASLMWLVSLAGVAVRPAVSSGSFNLVGASSAVAVAAGQAVLLVGLLLVYAARLRGRVSLARAVLLAVVLVVATSRVESAQYLIWIAVLASLEEPLSPAWLAVFALTSAIYPLGYSLAGMGSTAPMPIAYPWWLMAAIAARNALLVVAAAGRSLSAATRDPPTPPG